MFQIDLLLLLQKYYQYLKRRKNKLLFLFLDNKIN
jgi:hypothetical protein